ncbi:MAG: hypothetical protein HKL96_09120 [Phycisphaerales bacterium]|nr:hypothetical protein [Phycisphaerales bacterium]
MKIRTVTTGLATMLAVLALASVSLLAGCSSDKNASLMPGPTPPIADVPIPYGFTIDLSQSQSTYVPNTNLRVVNQLYRGSDPRLSVARFYMTNMPNSGWRMQQEIQNPQATTETFIKGPETCTVAIKHSWWHTLVYVTIVPTEAPSTTTPPPAPLGGPAGSAPPTATMPAAPAGGS